MPFDHTPIKSGDKVPPLPIFKFGRFISLGKPLLVSANRQSKNDVGNKVFVKEGNYQITTVR
jgi:hypothetical protein